MNHPSSSDGNVRSILGIVLDEALAEHDPGRGHPESPARIRVVNRMARELALPGVTLHHAEPASIEAVSRVHDTAYLATLESVRGKHAGLDPDTAVSPESVASVYRASGCVLTAVERVFTGASRRAFALVRPPGHHAERNRAMGFCLLNHVAIAAEHARAMLGCERVLIIDWDVHHGNGTQQAFYERDDVTFFSSHQFPYYPGTGAFEEAGRGAGLQHTINAPLPRDLGDAEFCRLYRELLPAIGAWVRPQLVIVSAGFDAHRDDPLGGMRMSEDGFARLCQLAVDVADTYAEGRIVLSLEGGYDLPALTRSARACIEVLAGSSSSDDFAARGESPQMAGILRRIAELHPALSLG